MMTRHKLLMAAAAVSLSFSATSFAAGASGSSSGSADGGSTGTPRGAASCEGLTGTALQTCLQQEGASSPGTTPAPGAGSGGGG